MRQTRKRTTPRRAQRQFGSALRVSSGFRDLVLDHLSAVDGLRSKAMFGGIGLYAGDLFFAIVAADVLYFKVTEANRREYDDAGAPAFMPYAGQPTTMSYRAVPLAVLESPPDLIEWARRAIAAARAAAPHR